MIHRHPIVATTGWGVYCACSWTWCIGMFLPVILLGRYGWWGFLAFAIPNIIGCAAFGYVLRSRERSRELIAQHRTAMRLFSLVTVTYHVFFLGFVLWLLMPEHVAGTAGEDSLWVALSAPLVVLVLGQVLADVPTRYWPAIAAVVYAGSLLVFASIGVQPLSEIGFSGAHATIDVLWLAPVMIFGFALCPYFDLTFHRALQHTPSRHAFGVFGLTFAVMIVLTCAYWDILTNGLTWLVLGHIMAQAVFTISAHLREGTRPPGDAPRPMPRLSTRLLMLLPLIGLPVALLGAFVIDPLAMSTDNYLRFLVFYGLVFPAYAALFMGPAAMTLSRRSVVIFAIACLLCMPLYEAGFLHRQAWVLIIPPVLFLLWRAHMMLTAGRVPQVQDRN